MNVKEEAEKLIESMLSELGSNPNNYKYYIPDWEPQSLEMALRWLKSQIWEGFSVSYEVNHNLKSVELKSWEEDFE